MNSSGNRDLVVGLFVLAALAGVAFLSFRIGGLDFGGQGGLTVYAAFDQIGGLKPRAPVEISGVRVGEVRAIGLDEEYRARVELDLDKNLELPVDTSASIVTSGLLGDQYIALEIGGEEDVLGNGDEITFTESAVILERLIGQFIHGTKVDDGADADAE